MTNKEPNVTATSRYSINETCVLLGITRKTLLKYTQAGIIRCDYRKATMRRYYTGASILKFWTVSV